MEELNGKLIDLKYKKIERWTGETFDQESNPSAQLEDINKLHNIAIASMQLATTAKERVLTQLASKIAMEFSNASKSVIDDTLLSEKEVRDVVIGEGNLRVVATK